MTFDKQVLYLGSAENEFRSRDTGRMERFYSVQFFDQSVGAPVSVNVMDNADNGEMLASLLKQKFGTPITVTFILRPKDKLYKLGITHVSF